MIRLSSGKNQEIGITVIIPVYNGEKYLRECLDSVVGQTYGNFEVILVDDCSTDCSASIIDEYVEKDGRFRKIRNEKNGGLSFSRNRGIEEVRTSHVTFLDADDCLYPQCLELMADTLVKTNSQVAFCNFARKRDYIPVSYEKVEVETFDYRKAMEISLYQKMILNSAWGKLVPLSFVKKAGMFTEGIWYEDLDSYYRFYEPASLIAYIKEPLYFYRDNEGSFINRWTDGRLDVLDVTDRMLAFFEEKYPALADAARDRRFSAHFNILTLIYKNGIDRPDVERRCWNVIKEGRRRELKDGNVRLKNKAGALASYGGVPLVKILSKFI